MAEWCKRNERNCGKSCDGEWKLMRFMVKLENIVMKWERGCRIWLERVEECREENVDKEESQRKIEETSIRITG